MNKLNIYIETTMTKDSFVTIISFLIEVILPSFMQGIIMILIFLILGGGLFFVSNFDVFGVPQSEAIDVPSLARTFELQKHFSGCFKSWMNFSTLVQYSGVLNASYIENFYEVGESL